MFLAKDIHSLRFPKFRLLNFLVKTVKKVQKKQAFFLLEVLLSFMIFLLLVPPLLHIFKIRQQKKFQKTVLFEQWAPFAFLHAKQDYFYSVSSKPLLYFPNEHFQGAPKICLKIEPREVAHCFDAQNKRVSLMEIEISCGDEKVLYTVTQTPGPK